MADVTFNIAKGRIVELYKRVKDNDPANAAFIIVPIETTGIVSDAVMKDYDTLAALLAGASNEQSTMGRKTLTEADLDALPAPDDTNDWIELSLPAVTWTAASGNPISALIVCFDPDTTSGDDSTIVPCTKHDFAQTPSGANIVKEAGVFHKAA